MPKIMFIYRQNEWSRFGRPLKKLLGEVEIGLLRPNYWQMMIMMMVMMMTVMMMTTRYNEQFIWAFLAITAI